MMKTNQILRLAAVIFFLTAAGCASLPDNSSKHESNAYGDPGSTLLGKKYAERAVQHPQGQSAYHLLSDGLDAFVARAALAQVAERSIDSQYYMVHADLVGRLYLDQLLKAADRGVKVRFLLDDMDEGERDFGLAMLDFHPNIEVRIFQSLRSQYRQDHAVPDRISENRPGALTIKRIPLITLPP